ncbi:MAG TPA: CerR family C-terminal domain-containing protein [Blastocatellia bacterium]|nr:CerR family C-terminal domain-containing protein [Blastocatellia bacterium]
MKAVQSRTAKIAAAERADREDDARTKLLNAASRLFAARGFGGVSVRELAQEAGVNIASVNYHFGSKENLYLDVVRLKFREIREAHWNSRAVLEAEQADTPEAARQAIRRFIAEYMESIVGPNEPDQFFLLMAREMMEPTIAIDVVVEEFIEPRFKLMEKLIGTLRPDLAGTRKAKLCAMSIAGQCLYYRFAHSVVLRLLKRKKLSGDYLHEIAEHIADFTFAALSNEEVEG